MQKQSGFRQRIKMGVEVGITDNQVNHPLVLGHEFAGVSGAGVRVAVDPAISFRISDFCRTG